MTTVAVTNPDRIRALAEVLKRLAIPREAEEPRPEIPRELLPDVYFVLVAICHQTSPSGEPALVGEIAGKEFKGWDYLAESFLRAAQRDPSWFSPDRCATVRASDIEAIIQIGKERVHLNRLEERAELIRDLGERMRVASLRSVTELFVSCDRTLVRQDGSGLLRELGQFRAFRDPVQKKTSFFVSLMENQGLWDIRDLEHLPPPVDYHEVRGHLRCGTVSLDADLERRVRAGLEIPENEDIAIRAAVSGAIQAIGLQAGLPPSRLHYLFWNVYRNCCKKASPHCDACPQDCELPDRYAALTAERRRCVFSEVCASKDRPDKLVEHRTVTDFY